MIEFKCHCSQPISVDDEQAGGLIQCPRCGRLNDVPTLSDLRNLDADGGFKISELEIVEEPQRLQRVTEAFTRSRYDESGEEIDLRPTIDDVDRAGIDEIPLATDEHDLIGTPKYDPITGELVEPIKIKTEPKDYIGDIPMATPVLGYAGRVETPAFTPLSIGVTMFAPQNLFVVFIILWIHCFLNASIVPVMAGLFFFFFVPLIVAMLLAGHYGRVIQETGPGEQDELPRPFGSLSLRDDVWDPFCFTAIALAFSYGPYFVVLKTIEPEPARLIAILIALAWGVVTFPAAFLTAMTSGTIYNMRPDRVISVILKSGSAYFIPMFLMIIAPVIYTFGIGALLNSMFGRRGTVSSPGLFAGAGFFALFAGIFLLHWACWALGLIYRAKNASYPWIFQRHIYQNRTRNAPRRTQQKRK